MKTGNKKQAIALSVVAVLAVGFLGYQLMPSAAKPSFVSSAPEVKLEGTPGTAQNLSLAVLGNPFSHPKLAKKVLVTALPPVPNSLIDKSGSIPPFNPQALTPGAGEGGLGEAVALASGTPQTGKKPEESAGKSRSKARGPRIKLNAIMRVGEPVAMLAVDDRHGITYSEGDVLAPGTRLIVIGDGSVTVRIFGEEHKIATGETYPPEDNKK